MPDTLVLDTNALIERGFAFFLRSYRGRKVLPSVAAAELFRHFWERRGWGPAEFFDYLHSIDVVIEPLDGRTAVSAVLAAGPASSERTPDNLIAGHALAAGRMLVTRNVRDFPHIERKATPASLLRRN